VADDGAGMVVDGGRRGGAQKKSEKEAKTAGLEERI
jgi:hypothetical protein